jgi:hypothetical protein
MEKLELTLEIKNFFKCMGIKSSVNAVKTVRPVEVTYFRVYPEKIMPNEIRLKICNLLNITPLHTDNVCYGNITSGSISLHGKEWLNIINDWNK